MQKNRFVMLNSIDVNDHVEKKNGLTYLSWAWAWTEFKKVFPDSYYTIYETQDGNIYFTDGKTCWVKTGVTLVDGDFTLEHIEYLPIMDYRNQSIKKENVTSMDANKSIQRSLTKAISRHGLGAYIYAGEDMPEESEEKKQARLDEAKRQEQIANAIAAADLLFGKCVVKMNKDDKIKYLDEVVVPIIGQRNYKACKDLGLLTALVDKLSAEQAKLEAA